MTGTKPLTSARAQAANAVESAKSCADLASAVSAGRVTYDDSQSAARIAVYTDFDCATLTPSGVPTPAACKAAIAGLVAKDDSCFGDLDCAGASSCVGAGKSGACEGKCEPLLAPGATCSASTSHCSEGYGCRFNPGATAGTCTVLPVESTAAEGEACGTDEKTSVYTACQADLACDSSTPNKCIAKFALGQSCASDHEACIPFTFCDGTTSKCVEGAASGAKCGFSQSDYGCAAGLVCKMTGASVGTCIAPASTGAACTTAEDCISSACGTDQKCAAACSLL